MFKKIIMALAKKYIEEEKLQQEKEREELYKKYDVMLGEAYKWFYQYIQMSGPTAAGIDLPFDIDKLARYNAQRAFLKVVKENRVDEVYQNCVKHIEAQRNCVQVSGAKLG